MHGHYQMVEILLGQGAEINAADKNGWTPLHCAAKAGHLDVVRLLCESGASPKNETNYGVRDQIMFILRFLLLRKSSNQMFIFMFFFHTPI